MSWFTRTFSSTIGRKIIMSLTGLFLCSFLVIHLAGNLQLLREDGGQAFNIYSRFMSTNVIIRSIEVFLFLGFIFHIYDGLYLAYHNRKARGRQRYAVNRPEENSNWSSRNMALLGTILLVFLVLHLYNFFYVARFGELDPVEIEGVVYKNVYTIVVSAFQIWWYVAIYVISMIALAYHLIHGFASAFQTLGLNHKKYTPAIKAFGYGFSIIISAGFAMLPLYFYFFR
jgi:succinate dehydrogenase / fumarate reductase, cytochrome b subunit